jgi:hypothetical protein
MSVSSERVVALRRVIRRHRCDPATGFTSAFSNVVSFLAAKRVKRQRAFAGARGSVTLPRFDATCYYFETACIFINLQRLVPGGLFKLNLAPPEAPLSRDRTRALASKGAIGSPIPRYRCTIY